MTMSLNSIEEQLHRAIESNDIEELSFLSRSSDMNIRRAVARNRNIDSKIANILAQDPVLNISYMASQNENCTIKREFDKDILTSCVLCEISELDLKCVTCNKK